jgi:hypothetical protein
MSFAPRAADEEQDQIAATEQQNSACEQLQEDERSAERMEFGGDAHPAVMDAE